MENNSLGDRMKEYENISRIYLTKRSPVIIRIDGKAFHSFTKGFIRPFDKMLMETMAETAKFLAENISGCKLAYTQSDEISLLLTDYDTIKTQPWFENNLQKLVSIAASMATLQFNRIFTTKVGDIKRTKHHLVFKDVNEESDESSIKDLTRYCDSLSKSQQAGAMFDARAFILPSVRVAYMVSPTLSALGVTTDLKCVQSINTLRSKATTLDILASHMMNLIDMLASKKMKLRHFMKKKLSKLRQKRFAYKTIASPLSINSLTVMGVGFVLSNRCIA